MPVAVRCPSEAPLHALIESFASALGLCLCDVRAPAQQALGLCTPNLERLPPRTAGSGSRHPLGRVHGAHAPLCARVLGERSALLPYHREARDRVETVHGRVHQVSQKLGVFL
jgi:hypothetical protein